REFVAPYRQRADRSVMGRRDDARDRYNLGRDDAPARTIWQRRYSSAQAIANAATAGTRGIVRRMAIRWRVMGSCFEDGSQKKNSALVNSRQWFIQYSLVDRAGR